jgi:hypothetical protein
MEKIKFDPNGPALKVDIQYLGALTASYVYTLWDTDTNAIVEERKGNNQNSQDDNYTLPQPTSQNKNRIIDVFSTLKNGDNAKIKGTVVVKVFQGQKKIGEVRETEVIEAKKTAINNIFIQLIP